MNRNPYTEELQGTLPEGDMGWRGVNMRVAPAQLSAGWAARAVNMRFTDGRPQSRAGKCPVVWLNKVTGGQPGPWGKVYGRGNFFDPETKVRFHLIAADGGVFYSRANNATTALALPPGESVTTECEFYQCFNVVVLARGGDLAPLVMVSLDRGFELITQTTAGDGTLAIPNFLRGLSIGNRLLVVRAGTDEVVASDLQDYTRYVLPDELRVNQGEADRIVALAAFGPETVITLKEGRVYQTTGVAGDLSGVATSLVTDRYGCVAARTVVRGDDLYWLSQEGVASLTLTIQNEVQASAAGGAGGPRMFSDDIQPLIDRINWNYASGACAAFHRKRLYLAVPLDDAVSFRDDLVTPGTMYIDPGVYFFTLEVGKSYRWIPGPNEAIADNGNAVNHAMTGPMDFTAESGIMSVTSTVVFPSPLVAVTGSLRPILKGVNNGVLVYNFVNEAWEGLDQASGLEVKFFFVFPYNGRDRLFFVSPDGWVNLYEETSEDGLSVPMVEVVVSGLPAVGNTIRVNGGTVVTAANTAANTAGGSWGCDSLGDARGNLSTDDSGNGFQFGTWTAPGCFVVRTPNGVRFYGKNGVLPAVVVTGSWATLTYHTRQGIATDFVSRGYATAQRPLGVKRGQELEVQMETWAPQYSLSVIGEGVSGESVFVTAETRDRTKFDRPWDAPPFAVDNSGNNFAAAGRQDYSVVLATAAAQLNLQSGIALDLHQEVRRKAHAPARAQAAQVRVVNTAGRIRILGIGYKGFEIEQNRKGAR